MLHGIGVKNYRTFPELTEFHFAPITILLGANSSGKSSITRLLPLFAQSLTQRAAAPILWVSDNLDYGSFRDNVTEHDRSRQLTFCFHGRPGRTPRPRVFSPLGLTPIVNTPFRYSISIGEGYDRTQVGSVEIEIFGQKVRLECPGYGFVSKIYHNDEDKSSLLRGRVGLFRDGLFPAILLLRKNQEADEYDVIDNDELVSDAADILRKYAHANTSKSRIIAIYRSIMLREPSEMASSISARASVIPSLKSRVSKMSNADLMSLWMLKFLETYSLLMSEIKNTISPDIMSGQYLGPIRAQAARYYRRQELAVDQIDPNGENLAMYLNSLSEYEREEINADLAEFFGYNIRVHPGEGHISLRVAAVGDDDGDNLADVGFGFSQLLPVIAQVHAATRSFSSHGRLTGAARADSPILAVEQPELHLHPAYQAKLGSYFVHAATKRSPNVPPFRFLIETHSEPLVNEVAAAVARAQIRPEDVNIYLFERSDRRKETRVLKATIQPDGSIPDWPFGFFTSGKLRVSSGLR